MNESKKRLYKTTRKADRTMSASHAACNCDFYCTGGSRNTQASSDAGVRG